MDGKLDRSFKRNDKVLSEIMKSKIDKKNKIDVYDAFVFFMTGFMVHLEEKCPYLKEWRLRKTKTEP